MKYIDLSFDDVMDYFNIKKENKWVLAEIIVYKYLKQCYGEVEPAYCFDFKCGDKLFEVKLNSCYLHKFNPDQERCAYEAILSGKQVYLVTRKKCEFLEQIDVFDSLIGLFYVYKIRLEDIDVERVVETIKREEKEMRLADHILRNLILEKTP